jgi:hypothetical protein
VKGKRGGKPIGRQEGKRSFCTRRDEPPTFQRKHGGQLLHGSDVRDTHVDGSRKHRARLFAQPCPERRESEWIIPVEANLFIPSRIIGPIPLNAIEIFRTDS